MASFSYQQCHQFHLDPLLIIPNVPFRSPEKDHHTLDNLSPTTQDSTSHRSADQRLPIPDENFILSQDHKIKPSFPDNQKANYDNETYNATPESSSAIVDYSTKNEIDEQLSNRGREIITKKKRNFRNVVSGLSSSPPKYGREGKSKKQKQFNERGKVQNRAERKEEKKQKDEEEEAPKDYIHVRARRGQATDSHSLAERVRREKISERMKMLQKIVPGCDKVAGKALMLDEIINYVQSLQNQVEFLSMKLASLSPVFYDFGGDLDAFMVRPEGLAGLMPRMQEMGLTASFPEDAVISTYPQLPNTPLLIPPQDAGGILRDVEDERQKFHDLSGFNNLCSFH